MRAVFKIHQGGTVKARHMLSIDESKFFHTEDEAPFDIILGYVFNHLIDASELSNAINLSTPLMKLEVHGHCDYRSYVHTEAFIHRVLDAPFEPAGCLGISIDLDAKFIRTHTDEIVKFSDLTEPLYDRFDIGSYARPPKEPHVFYSRHADDYICNPVDLEAGSITTGIFRTLVNGKHGVYTREFAHLIGMLLGKSGRAFTQDFPSGPRGGGSTMPETRTQFFRKGYVLSDRAWAPRSYLEGERFTACITASQPDLIELGEFIATFAQRTTPVAIRAALDALLEIEGLEHRTVGYRPPNGRFTPSNHEILEGEALLHKLAGHIGVKL